MTTELDGIRFDVALALRWDYLFDYSVYTARKTHGNCRLCHEPIESGDVYVRQILWTPWTLIQDDVDSEGRPVGSPAGDWGIIKEHARCVTSKETL